MVCDGNLLVGVGTGHTVFKFDPGSGYEGCWHYGDYLLFVDSVSSSHSGSELLLTMAYRRNSLFQLSLGQLQIYKTRQLGSHVP